MESKSRSPRSYPTNGKEPQREKTIIDKLVFKIKWVNQAKSNTLYFQFLYLPGANGAIRYKIPFSDNRLDQWRGEN